MACFWRDLVGTSQTCYEAPPVPPGYTHGLGNIVYIGSDPVNYPVGNAIFEVKKDLSGVIFHGYHSESPGAAYSKNQKYYIVSYVYGTPYVATLSRHEGSGVVSPVLSSYPNFARTGGPLGGVFNNDAGTVRAWTDTGAGNGFWETADGYTWTRTMPDRSVSSAPIGRLGLTVQLPGRFVAAISDWATWDTTYRKFSYTDDVGVTWNAASPVTAASTIQSHIAIQNVGSSVIAVDGGDGKILRTTDGASWSTVATLNTGFGVDPPFIASNGSGGIVVLFYNTAYAPYPPAAYSTDSGASWTPRTNAQLGIPDGSDFRGVWWSGTQFIAIVLRSDTSNSQMYTSPTGASWTASIIVPHTQIDPTQIIA